MNSSNIALKIHTLGRFSISVHGEPVATCWPDETLKKLFCSLLSPMDLYYSWDRICRSMLGVPVTRTSRRRLDENLMRPLNSFLIKELGFTPLITGVEGIRIDKQRTHVDAFEFHRTVVEGLGLLSIGNHTAVLDKFNRAKSLYSGKYLPGIPGEVIDNTRIDLESLYRTVVMDAIPLIRNTSLSGLNRRAELGLYVNTNRRPFQALNYKSIYQGHQTLC